MLVSRQCLYRARLFHPTVSSQWRTYADLGPSDPTDSSRGNASKPVNEPLGGGDSSGTDSTHAASAGHHGATHHAHHPEPVNESFGRGFFVSIAALAVSFAVYRFSRSSSSDPRDAGNPDKQPLITRFLSKFNFYQEQFARRNAMHTAAVEQAGHDRNLFFGSPASKHIDLRFPEIFNTGSPRNIPAGSTANLDDLRAHYHRENVKAEEKRVGRLKAVTGSESIMGHDRKD